jgi:hypothetical protein
MQFSKSYAKRKRDLSGRLQNGKHRFRRIVKMGRRFGATHTHESASVPLHCGIVREPASDVVENLNRVAVGRFYDTVMHPFSLPPDVHYTGSPQIRQMPGDFGLRRSEDLDEVADADFIAPNQI